MAGGHGDFGVFAVRVEHALAGAGWQDSTSQSIRARDIVQHDFAGLGSTALQVVFVDHNGAIAADPAAQHVVAYVTRALRSNPSVSRVVPPRPGLSLSRDGRTGIVTAGAAADPNEMVKAADSLAGPLHGLSRPGISVTLTGDNALWANFNDANRSCRCLHLGRRDHRIDDRALEPAPLRRGKLGENKAKRGRHGVDQASPRPDSSRCRGRLTAGGWRPSSCLSARVSLIPHPP